MKRNLALILLSGSLMQAAYALNTGDIAFTGFNADGNDDLAFVALVPITGGKEIFFTDNEWNGQAIGAGGAFNTGEMEFKWTAPVGGVPAGGIVVLIGVGAASPTANVGTVVHTVSSNLGISTT
ncbi:MAG: hypothetical protein JHC69_11875, partial [Akkermansiaceae bacterium]|nr:hypothetical protein [Akkermansiaceae bacterium]